MSTIHDPPSDWRSALGVTGLLVWLFMFGVVEYAHDMLVANRDGDALWSIVYEVSAGYVLGFVAALAAWMLIQLARGPVPEIIFESAIMRTLVGIGLIGVLLSALAGLVKHNLGGFERFVVAGALRSRDGISG